MGLTRSLLLTLLLASCSLGTPDLGSPPLEPAVFLRLGSASQFCVGPKGFAPVTIFANLYNMGKKHVVIEVDNFVKIPLYGDALQVDLAKVAPGEHFILMHTDNFHDVRISFLVANCN
jgi:hypothetical protein